MSVASTSVAPEPHCWFDGEWSGDYAIALPADTPPRTVALEIACAFIGGTEADFTDDEINRMTNAVRYCPLFSVVARDREFLGDDVDWHSDASGKRVKATWFMTSSVLRSIEEKGTVL